jgi:hypothetical protein
MRVPTAAIVAAVLVASACSPAIDLKTAARVTPTATGWFDAGVTTDGKNKLVPSIAFTLSNVGTTKWSGLQINCIFRRLGDPQEWSTVLVRGASAGAGELAPGATSPPIVVRAPQGYTGVQPRADLLNNKLFVDAKVEVFGKAGSANWVKLGEFRIARQLLTK